MSVTDVPTTSDRIRYQVDRFLSWSPFARFLGLFAISFVLVMFCAVLAKLVVTPDEGETFDIFEAMWFAMTRVADAGTMGGDKGTLTRFVATLATLSGVGVVALLIGLVSSTVGEKIENLRKGRSPVIDSGHTLILGFNEKIFAILRELREANSNQQHASIIILSDTDKEEVETFVRERMGEMGVTRVIVRQGSPFSVQDLRKVGAGRARSIIVLADDSARAGARSDAESGDMGAIKTLLALRRIPGALEKNHVVVELLDANRRSVVEKLGNGGVEVVAMAETLSRMMVQTSRQNGLAEVYRHLLSYEGSEFYFRAYPELEGQSFGDAQWKMKDGVVCGVRRPGHDGAAAQCLLNPPDHFLLDAGDELLVIAEDDDSFSLTAEHEPIVAAEFHGAPPIARSPERMLICGLSPKLEDMLRELDHYVLPGSEVCLMPGTETPQVEALLKVELKNLKLRLIAGDPTMPEPLKQAVTGDFIVTMVVADTSRDSEEADARTVITVLLLRELIRDFAEPTPRIISEILDPRTKDLLEQDYGADFVVSAEMTSMLLAQVSERRDLNMVFADLFDSDGNEIYLKRAACYAVIGSPTNWLAVQYVARQRNEVAIGYLRSNDLPVINPSQSEDVVLEEVDRVIVIAEDDAEALGDERGGELPQPSMPSQKARSPLLPPEPRAAALPAPSTVSAGPRVEGPSTAPRPPLPVKPKS